MKMKLFLSLILLSASTIIISAAEIIPITSWPKTISMADKVICNPTVDQCVKAGYRLLTAKPATPAGKRIKSEAISQDDKDPTKCKYDIAYEDIPEPTPVLPEILTNIPAERVSFNFTTNGSYRGVVWLDAPATNVVK